MLYHFGVILVSVGVFWRPWGCQGTPKGGPRRKSDEKVGSWALRGSSPGTPLGTQIDEKSRKSRSEKHVGKHCVRCCTRGVSGPPPTLKIMVLSKRNHRFHISIWSSKTTENNAQRVSFGTPLSGFWNFWAPFGRMNK